MGREMQQGEIVQCQGYMGARAQNRPYAEQGQGGSATTEREGVRDGGKGREKDLLGCFPIKRYKMHLPAVVRENVMPIADSPEFTRAGIHSNV